MKGASYARYSTDMQDQASIEAQLEENSKFAMQNGIEIIKTYTDEAYTGKTDSRPGFLNMIEDSKKNIFDCVIVHKIDRFARDRYDSAIYKAQLRRRGLKIFYSGQPLSDNAEGRLMEGILESFAQYYSENLSNEVMKGLKINAKNAIFNGGYAPLGYDIVDGRYQINEHEAKAVKMIFEMHSSGNTYDEILAALKQAGFKSRFSKDFKRNSLHSILHNEKYIGVYAYNKAAPRNYGHRNSHKKKDSNEIVIIEDAIPPIIDIQTWELSQKRMLANIKRGQLKAKETYLLPGLIKCHECGQPLFGDRRNNGYRTYCYYRCYNRECKKVNIPKDEVENFVLDRVRERYFSIEGIRDLVKQLNMHMKEKFDSRNSEIKNLESDIKKLNIEIDNIVKAISSGILSEALTSRLKDLEQAKRDLSMEIIDLQIQSKNSLYTEHEVKEILSNYKQAIDYKDITKCKKFIDKFVKNVSVSPEEVEVVLHVPF